MQLPQKKKKKPLISMKLLKNCGMGGKTQNEETLTLNLNLKSSSSLRRSKEVPESCALLRIDIPKMKNAGCEFGCCSSHTGSIRSTAIGVSIVLTIQYKMWQNES
jgi:hypothetical protein